MIKNHHDFKPIEGKYVNLREVEVEDAAFILKLRTSEKGKKFLHKTSPDIDKQIEYIKKYKSYDSEWYFIVENKNKQPLGCLSVYDIQGDSACTGRWIMADNVRVQESIEGDLLLKDFTYNVLAMNHIRTDTRYENKNMINYFKMWHCQIIRQDNELIYFNLPKEVYENNKKNIERFCK